MAFTTIRRRQHIINHISTQSSRLLKDLDIIIHHIVGSRHCRFQLIPSGVNSDGKLISKTSHAGVQANTAIEQRKAGRVRATIDEALTVHCTDVDFGVGASRLRAGIVILRPEYQIQPEFSCDLHSSRVGIVNQVNQVNYASLGAIYSECHISFSGFK